MKFILSITFIMFFLQVLVGQNDSTDRIIDLAQKLDGLLLNEFLDNSENEKALTELLKGSNKLTISEIENNYLKHKNPKVRALGLLCLYQRDSHVDLLKVSEFREDNELCFKIFYNIPGRNYSEDYTVAEIAHSILRQYFWASSNGGNYDDEIDSFIEKRKSLKFTAGYLKLLRFRATGHDPIQESRFNLINKFKDRINGIEDKKERAIYKLYLSTNEYNIYSTDELLKELKILGKKDVYQILQKKPPIEDLDIECIRNSNFDYEKMCEWILLNAKQIFNRNDIPFLLARYNFELKDTSETKLNFAFWHIAAARLDLRNSSNYLKSCLVSHKSKFDRIALIKELWRLKGLGEIEYVLNFVFEAYRKNELDKERIDSFLFSLNAQEDITLLKRLVQDSRIKTKMKINNIARVASQLNIINENELIDHNRIIKLEYNKEKEILIEELRMLLK